MISRKEFFEWELIFSVCTQTNFGSCPGRKTTRAGNKIGVNVCFQNVNDSSVMALSL